LATQVFADQELEALRKFPEIGRDELFRFFTLTPADVAFVDPGRGRGPADRLGLAVAVCSLPCVRCRGWGSYRTTSRPRPGRRWCGWRSSFGSTPCSTGRSAQHTPGIDDEQLRAVMPTARDDEQEVGP
jgi:hypothetical protein